MEEFLKQIESGTADFPIYTKENFQDTFDNFQTFDNRLFGVIMPDLLPTQQSKPTSSKTTLIILDGEMSILNPNSPPNLHPIPKNASILRIK